MGELTAQQADIFTLIMGSIMFVVLITPPLIGIVYYIKHWNDYDRKSTNQSGKQTIAEPHT